MIKITHLLSIIFSTTIILSYAQTPCTVGNYQNNAGAGIYFTNFTTSGGDTNINNSTGFGNSSTINDYTLPPSQEVTTQAGNTLDYSVTFGRPNLVFYAIYLDSDGDGNFTSLEYMDGMGTGTGTGGTVTGSFAVPSTLAEGTYRLRIVCDYYFYESSYYTTQSGGCGGTGTLAGLTGYGEVEDYSLTVAAPPSCGTPSGLTATVDTFDDFTTADLAWTAGDLNDTYTLSVYTGTDTTATPVASSTTTSTSASVSGLTTNTSYTAVLSASCGSESATTISTTFTTNHLISGAHTEDFGTYSALGFATQMGYSGGSWYNSPNGINFAAFTGDASPYMPNTGPTVGGGTDGGSTDIYWSTYYTTATSGSDVIFTPYFDVSSMTTPRLSIDYHINGTSAGNLTVTLIQSDGTETDVISYTGAQQISNSDSWRTGYADLSSYDEVVRFKITGTYGGSVSFDDFIIEETPNCSAPSSLSITNVTSSSATYSFTLNNNNTGYSWGTLDSFTGNMVTEASGSNSSSSQTTVTIDVTGLSPSTSYEVFVRGLCDSSGGGQEHVSSPIVESFTTQCSAVSTGFSENFNGLSSIPSCWEISNGGDSNTWEYRDAWNLTGASFGGGVGILYSAAAHDDYLYSPEFTVTDGLTDGLSFNALSPSSIYPEPLDISVVSSTTGQTTLIYDDYEVAAYETAYHSEFYDLSAFEGQDIKIAFHSSTTDMNIIIIDNFVIDSASIMLEGWAGFQSEIFSYPQNWYAGVVPTEDVTIKANTNSASYSPVIMTDVNLSSLTLESQVDLLIAAEGSLTLSGDLITNNGGGLVMSSEPNFYSSLIVGGTHSGDAPITYDRWVNEFSTSGADITRWDLVGSMVEEQFMDVFASNNDDDLATYLNESDGLLYYGFGPFDNTTTNGWSSVYNTSTVPSSEFDVGIGYQMGTVSGGSNIFFKGTVATAPQNITIVDNSSSGGTQWNLIANPFPSYLNLNSAADPTNNFITENGLSVYGWSATTSGYTVYNNVSPTPAASYIAPGQGFFVSAADGTTSVNFTADMRTTSGGDDFVAGRLSGSYTYFYLDMLNQNGNSIDNSMLYFDDNMTHGYDQGYDAESFDQSSSLMSRLLNGYEGIGMQVNAMPTSSLDDSTIVSLDINRLAGTAFTISLGDSFNIPADVDIYLEDREEQTFTDLKNGDFSITPTTNLSGTGRFYLVFGTNSLGSDDFDMSHINAYKPFNADHLVIEGLFNIETASVSMYNIIGQEVLNVKLNANQAIEKVSTLGMNAGVYIVNIQADNNTITKKIIIN